MMGWCFKCGRIMGSQGERCEECGTQLSEILPGDVREKTGVPDKIVPPPASAMIWRRAIPPLVAALAVNPDDTRTRLKLSDVYVKAGRIAEACENYSVVAELFLKDGFTLKAIAVFKQILKHAPKSTEHRRRLAVLYRSLDLILEAEREEAILSESS